MLLNFGSGESKIEGAINCDVNILLKPNIVCDLREDLPFKNKSIDRVFLIHVIEHLEKNHHFFILKEFNRILIEGGQAIFAFPEFVKCAQNYIDNKGGKRDWWEKTVFGRQAWLGDFHVCAMNAEEFCDLLNGTGFSVEQCGEESEHERYNTFIIARKTGIPCERQDVFRKEIFEKAEDPGCC